MDTMHADSKGNYVTVTGKISVSDRNISQKWNILRIIIVKIISDNTPFANTATLHFSNKK